MAPPTATATATDRTSIVRSRRRSLDRRIVRAVTAAAALAAVAAGGEATGLAVVDALWRAALAAVVTAAASRSRRWSWLWMAGLASAAAVGSPALIPSSAALLLALLGVFQDRRNRVLGACIGALTIQALLRLPDLGFHGLTALVTASAVAPALWSGYDRSQLSAQQRILRALAGSALVVFVLLVGLAIATISARNELQRGVSSARTGLEMIRAGDHEQAAARFERAASAFTSAHDALSSPWSQPARALPLVSQQVDALVGMSEAGGELARSASRMATSAPYHQLRAKRGTIDLELVRAMQQPVEDSTEALRSARERVASVRSPWLVPPIGSELDEFASDLDRSLPQAELASEGLRVAPRLLGGEGRRRYLLLFTSPAETRFLGGFVGSYGVLTALDGELTLERSGASAELSAGPGDEFHLEGFEETLVRYGRYQPQRFVQNLTVSPDLPTDAALARAVFPQTPGGEPIDGVIVADPFAIAALLELTGPVPVEGLDTPLDPTNAARYLLEGQYQRFEGDLDARRDRLAAAARATFDALLEADLPGPRRLGDVLGPMVEQKRLLVWTFDDAEQAFLEHLGAAGRFSPPDQSDYLSVRVANANANKIDAYLHRIIDYDVRFDPGTGQLSATLTVELVNDSPGSGLPPYVIGNHRGEPPGTNTTYLSLYTPSLVVGATIDGRPLALEPQRELGGTVWSALVSVPPQSRTTLRFQLEGQLPGGTTYHLAALSQPLAHPDLLRVRVSSADGAFGVREGEGLEIRDGSASGELTWSADHWLRAGFRRR
ncbi:DUF4012 domain-containing protein [Rhabdothermincola sediminis]|uniref:DUF4012 domain-containing protein n=1 Tax=Rhabdothermincola sediminis TaxID=2751370 RepID=UPI001AA01136|nr:DUF4012 domain-containing protein [Rhabdothermincola sediminis]